MSADVVRQIRADADRAWRALLSGEDGAGVEFARLYRLVEQALAYAARTAPDADGGPGAYLRKLARPNVAEDEWPGR